VDIKRPDNSSLNLLYFGLRVYYWLMSDNSTFSFKYIESGGLTARYLLISFDPNTNTLHYSTDASGAIASEKPVTDSDLKDLKDALTREGFFNTQTTYSPKENETYVASNLSVTMGDKVHTTTWADTSTEVPEGLKKIADEIKKLIVEKK
jgi:hypothetical protein